MRLQMETKDIVVAVGMAVTFVLGLWNLWINLENNKRTTFVNTVTSQRIKWIEQLRQDLGAFSGHVYHWCFTDIKDEEDKRKIVEEIDRLRYVIRLRLNPEGDRDKEISTLMESIAAVTSDPDKIKDILEKLTVATQALLKEEWDKVKTLSNWVWLAGQAQ